MRPRSEAMSPESAAAKAVSAVGCGYDLATDLRLASCKKGPSGSRLIELDETLVHDLVLPCGIALRDVPKSIKSDKGERMRFRSDVLSFHHMAEQFNQDLSLSSKIPSGLFNAMFGFPGCWQKDLAATKSLAFDGWFVTLYSIELARSHIELHEKVKQDVPFSWDPTALAEFIEKYGTHIIVGIKMGGKDVVYVKQHQESVLQHAEVQNVLKKLADHRFSEDFNANFILGPHGLSGRLEGIKLANRERKAAVLKSVSSTIVTHMEEDEIFSTHVRRGGINTNQSHNQWLSTISQAPDVISMSLVPITSLLTGVRGSGFLSHAVNLYLRYKPPIEELQQFLEFQLPRQWAPVFGEIPLGPQHRKRHRSFPSLQFTLMGPRLRVNTSQVSSKNRPVTGLRLHLEGKRSDCVAVHLQHLSTCPDTLQLSDGPGYAPTNDTCPSQRSYFEPIRWALLSHVCTAPVEHTGASIDEPASIATGARLEVRDIGMRKVLFLRLSFSHVSAMRIRRSEWDGPTSMNRKSSGSISAMIGARFSTGMVPTPKAKLEINSAIFPGGPPAPVRAPKMSRFVDTSEVVRGPDELPGYWVVTGAKLCVQGGVIFLKVKYSLLVPDPGDE